MEEKNPSTFGCLIAIAPSVVHSRVGCLKSFAGPGTAGPGETPTSSTARPRAPPRSPMLRWWEDQEEQLFFFLFLFRLRLAWLPPPPQFHDVSSSRDVVVHNQQPRTTN
ncbi:unnamed protein product [Linum trigynum]|uniref:Uncharacterized protein n=1 Tax=Linum trigynum TaxID=586398 RepID=A0AAV2DTS3_9ROSI